MVEIVESEGQTWQDQKGTLPNQGMILGTILAVGFRPVGRVCRSPGLIEGSGGGRGPDDGWDEEEG